MNILIFILFTFTAYSNTFAENTETCGNFETPLPYNYCITKTKGSTNPGVLYYFHGGGGNETQWRTLSSGIYKQWLARQKNPPTVISLSFGPYWLLVEQNRLANSGLLDFFEHVALRQLELMALGKMADERSVMGLSMGGFNTAKLLAKLPAQTLNRAVLVCPALVDLSPYASVEQIANYVLIHPNTDAKSLENLALIVQAFVPNDIVWNATANPLVLTDKVIKSQTEIMIATNKEDSTFAPGGKLFAQKLSASQPTTIVQEWDGGHCELNDVEIANFLIP